MSTQWTTDINSHVQELVSVILCKCELVDLNSKGGN